ncbi:MAG: pilus assembly protein PilM [Chloroflexota bacterium]|nr:pilus assembly protein PilM [Chloroflexota bacterium]
MAREATTIYIDDSAIWVLVTRGRRPQKWASMTLEPGMVKNGVILNQAAVASRVRQLWKSQGIGSQRVIAGISGINCLYRLIILPEVPQELLPEAVKREAGRVLGVPLEQLYLSWQSLPSARRETLVYIAASPKNVVDALLSTLHQASLNPYLMELKPLALARTATEREGIIIDLQPASFDIVIMTEKIPQVIRSVSVNREDLTEKKIALIREELGRTITFYNSAHKDKSLDFDVPLLVSGELAQQEDFWKLLVGRQKRPVQVLPSPVETPEGFPSEQYMTSIGLALKEVLPSEKGAIAYSVIDINALPEAYLPKPRSLVQMLFLPTILAGIALVVTMGFLVMNTAAHTADLQKESAAANAQVISQRAQLPDIEGLTEQVSLAETTAAAFTDTLDKFSAGRDELNGDLAEIDKSQSGLNNVKLNSVSHDGDVVTVNGVAGDVGSALSYARSLRASGRFVCVVITSMIEIEGEEFQMGFTLVLTKEVEEPS